MDAAIVIDSITIQQDPAGRFCLNDLHKAAGGEDRDQPSKFLRLDKTQEMIGLLRNSPEMVSSPMVTIEGRNGGTYVSRELVYAYAMWISAAFHLKVIRVFDAIATGRVPAGAAGPLFSIPSGQVQDRVAALLTIGQVIARIPGVKEGIAWAGTLEAIRLDTQLPMEPLRKALPPPEGPVGNMSPSELGKRLGGLSAQKVNRLLQERGLQVRNGEEWETTPEGSAHAERIPFSKHGHSGYQLLWKETVIPLLQGPTPAVA